MWYNLKMKYRKTWEIEKAQRQQQHWDNMVNNLSEATSTDSHQTAEATHLESLPIISVSDLSLYGTHVKQWYVVTHPCLKGPPGDGGIRAIWALFLNNDLCILTSVTLFNVKLASKLMVCLCCFKWYLRTRKTTKFQVLYIQGLSRPSDE